jgi:hypothetical protein
MPALANLAIETLQRVRGCPAQSWLHHFATLPAAAWQSEATRTCRPASAGISWVVLALLVGFVAGVFVGRAFASRAAPAPVCLAVGGPTAVQISGAGVEELSQALALLPRRSTDISRGGLPLSYAQPVDQKDVDIATFEADARSIRLRPVRRGGGALA